MRSNLDELISCCPRIVTRHWLDVHRGMHLEVSIVRYAAEAIAANQRSWPWGLGPLERIFGDLDKSLGLRAAQALARSPKVTAELSPAYLTAATARIYQALEAGALQAAARQHEVLLAAVEPEGLEDAAVSRRRVWGDWLDVAGKLLGEYQDERLYGLAVQADAALSAFAQNDPVMQADVGYRFAGVLLAPLVSLSSGYVRFVSVVKRRC